uniref:Uncharacterized protein n=2 Tax=Daphnia magna TaxID=35525 RepID=A0A0N8E0R8_9CRUS
MENLRLVSDEYFRSLNSIAKRICDDISSTRENYESAWNYLSVEEQNQVINESLIYPDAVLRYSIMAEPYKPVESFPTLKLSCGCKVLQDDTGAEWRDEHSAPFSWKTSSQMLDISSKTNPSQAKETNQLPKKKKPPMPPPKPPKAVITQDIDVKAYDKSNNSEMVNDSSSQQDSSTLSEDEFSSLSSQVLPKTGCEFLDNW